MYVYPYGDSQQLNLDWIINKLKELEDREISAADLEEIANVFIALTHSSGTQYRRYDYCYYQDKLYRALNDNIGAFNASDWMEVRLGDDLSILTRLINTAAIMDVKFDTSGTDGKLQQKYGASYHDIVAVDYTPVQNSKRPLSSNAGYHLNTAINSLNTKTTERNIYLDNGSYADNIGANLNLTEAVEGHVFLKVTAFYDEIASNKRVIFLYPIGAAACYLPAPYNANYNYVRCEAHEKIFSIVSSSYTTLYVRSIGLIL